MQMGNVNASNISQMFDCLITSWTDCFITELSLCRSTLFKANYLWVIDPQKLTDLLDCEWLWMFLFMTFHLNTNKLTLDHGKTLQDIKNTPIKSDVLEF